MNSAALSLVILVSSAMLLGACATNPVTGSNDFVLVSEESEIETGRKAAPQILERFGKYDNPALQTYVQEIGERLAAQSHRTDLIYRFTVLDTPDVNAFALPGGYIYITRGMLAYLNSEAELAGVLAHEIGHVTARHSVRQQTAATAAGIGYTLGAILLPELRSRSAQEAFNAAGGALISGYGRDHELEADGLGAEYMARAGYDPQALIEVIGFLKNQEALERQAAKEEGREPRVYHGVFATHPDNDTRLQQVVAAGKSLQSATTTQINRAGFMKMLDGITYGDSEREGIRRGSNFYHKELGFALSFPQGWKVENRPSQLLAQAPGGDAILQMSADDINKRISPRDFLLTRLKLSDLQAGEKFTSGNLEGYTGLAPVRTPKGTRMARMTVLYFNDKAYLFGGVAEKSGNYDQAFLDTAKSFHALTPQERPLAEALHLKLITAQANTRYATLAKTSRIPNYPEEHLRLMNHHYPQGEPAAGETIKIVE
jgi:predicted Zn-dependent protease